jgi:hypothetical protein
MHIGNLNGVHASYTNLLVENEVDVRQPPLEAFGDDGLEAGDIEDLYEKTFNAVIGNRKLKRSANYTDLEYINLVNAWESISLDAVTSSDQTAKKYWQR